MCLSLERELIFQFVMEGIQIWQNDCLRCIFKNKGFIYQIYMYGREVKGQGQIYLKSAIRLVSSTPLSFYDSGCSYLTQCLLNVFR